MFYNPWFDFSGDLIWIRNNIPVILRFIESTLLGFSFFSRDEIDGIDGELSELYFFDRNNWKEIAYQVITGLTSSPLLLFSIAMVSIGSSSAINHLSPTTVTIFFLFGFISLRIFFPPLLIIAHINIGLILLYFLLRIMESFNTRQTSQPSVNRSRVQTFFLNGICVNEYWASQNCRRIKKRLQDKVGNVTSINNPSYGIVADLFESIVMRNFRVNSTSVCIAADTLERALKITDKGDIVRLIPHSQGTIIANLAVQRLYNRLSLENKKHLLKRLYVHTFAYADRNFINPKGLLGCVEHYVNKDDPIVLLGIDRIPGTGQYDGKIFVNNNGDGHLFNRYYSLNKSSYIPRSHKDDPELLS